MKEKTTNEEMNQVLKEMIQGGSSTSDNDRRAGRSYLERLSLQLFHHLPQMNNLFQVTKLNRINESCLTSNYHRLYPLYQLH